MERQIEPTTKRVSAVFRDNGADLKALVGVLFEEMKTYYAVPVFNPVKEMGGEELKNETTL